VQIFIAPLLFTVAYTSLTFPRDEFWDIYAIFLGIYWSSSAYGYLASIVSPPSLSQLCGVTLVFVTSMFAGMCPTLMCHGTPW
jgi:hypothetical protein